MYEMKMYDMWNPGIPLSRKTRGEALRNPSVGG